MCYLNHLDYLTDAHSWYFLYYMTIGKKKDTFPSQAASWKQNPAWENARQVVTVLPCWKAVALAALPGWQCCSVPSLTVSCVQHGLVQGQLCALARGVRRPGSFRSFLRLHPWGFPARGAAVSPPCRWSPTLGHGRPLPAAAGTAALNGR